MRIQEAWFFSVFLLFPSLLFAQCRPNINPMAPHVVQLEREMGQIFKNVPSQPFEKIPELPSENVIVPGKRAGEFELGVADKSLRARYALTPLRQKFDERYVDILAEGYAPERLRAKSKTLSIEFAFSTEDKLLKEIFVTDDKYSTSEGIRIGSPLTALERVKGLEKKRGMDKLFYFQGNGITVVTDTKKVVEIIVTRSTD